VAHSERLMRRLRFEHVSLTEYGAQDLASELGKDDMVGSHVEVGVGVRTNIFSPGR
jgi:hypothetical protein